TRFSRDWSSDVCSSDLGTLNSTKHSSYDRADPVHNAGCNRENPVKHTGNDTTQRADYTRNGTDRRSCRTYNVTKHAGNYTKHRRSEERRVGKEWRARGE